MVRVSNGKSLPLSMRLYLTVDTLHMQKQEMCPLDPNALDGNENEPGENEIRIVKIVRDEKTGLGLSIKGGAEHCLPIMISQIFKDQAADKTGKLFVGDAIIKVNGEMIVHCTHDEAVNILKNAGDLIMLTVKYYRAATPFLKKDENDKSNGESKPLCGKTNCVTNSLTLSKKWVDVTVVPLTMGYVSRYIFGSDKLRPNGFEVYGLNGVKSGIIYCDTPVILSQWLKYISDNISALIQLEIRMFNRFCSAAERIEFMGWVQEGTKQLSAEVNVWNSYEPKFFAIKGSEVYFFITPPVKPEDWSECECSFKMYESQLKIIKESDVCDERQHCLLFTSIGSVVKYLSVETRQELLKMESSWNTALCSAVRRLKEVKYTVNVGKPRMPAEFRIDWNYGYSLHDTQTNECIWKYRYSQLKGSSDDGISSLKLLFRDEKTGGIETRELESSSLELILYNMLAFTGSKFSLVDTKYTHPII
ncbi:hypothetical protein V9T40_006655 [Parthenolecanium corni]|uniref:PDZ domain-containing protein n=1 Tax=Parthenolecanium corni TaxID=536013 RepID=A0AAN9TR43_9HEMI